MLGLRSVASRYVAKRTVNRTSTKAVTTMNRSGARLVSKKPIVPEYSPHVSIYAFPFPAIVSIANRVAGVGLAGGFWAAGAASLVCPTAIPVVWGFVKTYPILLALAKAAIAFPLSYHYLAGIRHLVWDNTNLGLESVEAVERSSQILVGATAVITVGAALL